MPIRRPKPQRLPLKKLARAAYNPDAVRDALRPYPLPQRILTLRSIFNLSQEDMADALNVKRNTISNWEAEVGNPRRTQPTPRARRALAYVFDLPASLFVDDEPATAEEMGIATTAPSEGMGDPVEEGAGDFTGLTSRAVTSHILCSGCGNSLRQGDAAHFNKIGYAWCDDCVVLPQHREGEGGVEQDGGA